MPNRQDRRCPGVRNLKSWQDKTQTHLAFYTNRAAETLVFLGARLHADRSPTDASGVRSRLEVGWVFCCLYKRQMVIWFSHSYQTKLVMSELGI